MIYWLMENGGKLAPCTQKLCSHSTTVGGIPEHMHWVPVAQLGERWAYPTFLGEKLRNLSPGIEHIVTHEKAEEQK